MAGCKSRTANTYVIPKVRVFSSGLRDRARNASPLERPHASVLALVDMPQGRGLLKLQSPLVSLRGPQIGDALVARCITIVSFAGSYDRIVCHQNCFIAHTDDFF